MNGNIFVIGYSKVGKSPFAQHFAEQIGYKHISASEWVKQTFIPSSPNLSIKDYIKEITEYSKQQLIKENHNNCIRFIQQKYGTEYLNGKLVIDGIRNPRDFSFLFQPNTDKIILIEADHSIVAASAFERTGILAIDYYMHFLIEQKFVNSNNYITINYQDRMDIEKEVNECLSKFA